MDSMIGKKFGGRYVIEEEIGEGGMAKVYRARDTHFEGYSAVALKLIKSQVADEEFIKKFKKEAETLVKVKHPNIVEVKDFGEEYGINWIAMELIEGKTLEAILKEKKTLQRNEVLDIGRQVSAALNCAHENGVIHRDVKTGNIMLDKFGKAILTDFGIAKDTADSRKTMTGELIGSPSYMSPEQANEKEVDARTDLWSLGVILYEAFAGKRPFDKAGHYVNTLTSIIRDEPDMPRKFNKKIPKKVQNIIMKAIEKDRNERYQSAAQIEQDLKNYLDGNKLLAGGTLKKQIKKFVRDHPYIMAGTLTGIMAVSGILGYNQMKNESLDDIVGEVRKTNIEQVLKDEKKTNEFYNLLSKLETKIDTDKVASVAQRLKPGQEWPDYSVDQKKWTTNAGDRWNVGFWPHMLCDAFKKTGDKRFLEWAKQWTEPLEARKFYNKEADIGNIFYHSFVQLYDITKEPHYRDVALTAAETLSGRFNPKGKFLAAWGNKEDEVYSNITTPDSVANIDLLIWAYEQTGNKKFYDIALKHAETIRKNFVKDDGFTFRKMEFKDDKFISLVGGLQGKINTETNQCWATGHAMLIDSFLRLYEKTGKTEFKETAEKMIDYAKKHLTKDNMVYFNLNESLGGKAKDIYSTANYALALSGRDDDSNKILQNIISNYLITDKNKDPLLQHCFAKNTFDFKNFSLIQADYALIESLRKMLNEDSSNKEVVITRTNSPPALDGILNDECWQKIIPAAGFMNEKTGFLSENPTIVYMTYDNKNLYAAFKCYEPEKIKANARNRDVDLSKDDSVELFLDSPRDKVPCYRLATNFKGVQYDACAADNSFNPEWMVKTSKEGNWINYELKIPFEQLKLKMPQKNEEWNVNFVRNKTANSEYSSWKYIDERPREAKEGIRYSIKGNMLGKLKFKDK